MGPLSPWLLLGFCGALIASLLGGYVYGTHHEAAIWRASIAEQKAQAAQLLADRTKAVEDREQQIADLNAKLESEKHNAELDAADADTKLRAALSRVHNQARCGNDRAEPVRAGQSPAQSPDPPASSDDQLASTMDGLIADTARAANELAAYARECNRFALSLK